MFLKLFIKRFLGFHEVKSIQKYKNMNNIFVIRKIILTIFLTDESIQQTNKSSEFKMTHQASACQTIGGHYFYPLCPL